MRLLTAAAVTGLKTVSVENFRAFGDPAFRSSEPRLFLCHICFCYLIFCNSGDLKNLLSNRPPLPERKQRKPMTGTQYGSPINPNIPMPRKPVPIDCLRYSKTVLSNQASPKSHRSVPKYCQKRKSRNDFTAFKSCCQYRVIKDHFQNKVEPIAWSSTAPIAICIVCFF